MGDFICAKCGKTFKHNKNLKYHTDNNACKNREYNCKYCDKELASESSMYRHMRESCQVKKQNDQEKNEIYERLLKLEEKEKKTSEANKKLQKEVEKLKKVNHTVNNTSNNTKNTVNNTNFGTVVNNNIVLVGYGKEDLSKLSKNEMLKILQNGFDSSLKLTEAVHFNPKYPEYHNIYISNIKDKYAMMYDGKTWTLTMKEGLINKIYDDKKNYIEENLDDFLDSLTLSRKQALERWLDLDDENDKIKEIKNQIKLLLYNKRKMPIDLENKKEELHLEDDAKIVVRKKRVVKTIKDGS
jgi:hypothetical protein